MQLSTLFLFLTFLQGTLDELTPEQVAVDYFFTNTFEANYSEYKSLVFNELTRTENNYSLVPQCDKFGQELIHGILGATLGQQVNVNSDKCPIKTKKFRANSRKLQIEVYSRMVVDGRTFVRITVFHNLRFANEHFVELDSESGRVLDVCNAYQII